MSLSTPEKIDSLQKKLYDKAKNEPTFRFYSLYDKVWRRDFLTHAYRLAKANGGAPGVDGETFEQVEEAGLESWLDRLQEDLRSGTYHPAAVRRVLIPKPGGGERPLGIPTLRDRVAQTSLSLVLTPIFDADFGDELYGYRQNRSAQDAVEKVLAVLKAGYTDVVDADLSKYFDTIPHEDLLKSVARRVSDGQVLHLVKLWLKAPIAEKDERGRVRVTGGGKAAKVGTPQGGVISPLLANIYMNRFLRTWRERGMTTRLRSQVVNYADDFVVLCVGTAAQALDVIKRWMTLLKLTLNEKKTCLRNARVETFNFLGYTFGPKVHKPNGRRYLAVWPSDKAIDRLRERVRTILSPGNMAPWPEVVASLNRLLRGWANYFQCGSVSQVYWLVNTFVSEAAARFLVRRRKIPGRGTRKIPYADLYRDGLVRLLPKRRWNDRMP